MLNIARYRFGDESKKILGGTFQIGFGRRLGSDFLEMGFLGDVLGLILLD